MFEKFKAESTFRVNGRVSYFIRFKDKFGAHIIMYPKVIDEEQKFSLCIINDDGYRLTEKELYSILDGLEKFIKENLENE